MAKDIDRIMAHVIEPADNPLTKHLQQKFNRLKQMCALVMEHMNYTTAIELYVAITGVDESQAYRDMRDAKKIAGELLAVDRKFELLKMYNKLNTSIEKAENAGNFNAVMSGHDKALKYMDKITEGEMIDLTVYKPHTVILTFDPALLGDDLDLPEEKKFKKIVETLSTPRISIDSNDYTEFEEISEELKRSGSGTS